MTDHDTKQDHPGSDWVEILGREGYHTRFFHPGLRHVVIWNDQSKADESRAAAVAECRAISAAAREHEYQRGVAFGQGLANASNFQHLMRGIGQ